MYIYVEMIPNMAWLYHLTHSQWMHATSVHFWHSRHSNGLSKQSCSIFIVVQTESSARLNLITLVWHFSLRHEQRVLFRKLCTCTESDDS